MTAAIAAGMAGTNQGYRSGEVVRIRDERWRVLRHHPYAECAALEVAGADATNQGTTARYLLPFDVASRPSTTERPRVVRAAALRHAIRGALHSATPGWTSLRSPATARMSLLPFQLEPAIALTRGLATRVLIADAVGLGKTIQAGLIVAEVLARNPEARALIVTPAGLREQWRDELAERFDIAATLVDSAGIVRASAQVPPDLNPWSLPRAVVTSIDFVKRPDVMRALEALVWDVVVFDEAHGLTGRSDRSAAARLLAARGRRVILLTATPHSGDDAAFGTLCAMGAIEGDAQPLALFRRSRRVRASGCRRRSRLLAVAPTAAERAMFDVLQGYARGVRREAPREHAAGARLAMGILARRACSSAESLARSVERRLVLLGADAAPAAAQLQLPLADTDLDGEPGMELAVRGLPDEAEERAALVRILGLARAAAGRESKIAVLGRLLRRCRQPAIVFTEYRDTLERLADSLGLVNFAMLHGGLGAAERRRQLQRFTHGSAGVLLATDAASEGLNLHRRCRIAINLEMPWTPTRFEQRAGRVDRLGQARPPHVVTIAARGTFEDGVIARFLRRQASVQAAAPFDADSKQPQAAGVIALDLRSEADAEAHRVGQVVSAVAARRRGRPTAQTAEGPRPSAGILRRRMCSALYWGLALRFLDHRGALVWQAVVGCRAHAQLPCGASRGDARDALNAVTNAAAPELLQAAVLAHAKHLEQLTVEIRNATSMLGAREIAIEAALRRYQARLALRLLQPGLFDRRPAGDAEGEPLADALAAVGEHRAALDRLRHPVEGERELLFLVAAGA